MYYKIVSNTDKSKIKFGSKLSTEAENAFKEFLVGERTADYEGGELLLNDLLFSVFARSMESASSDPEYNKQIDEFIRDYDLPEVDYEADENGDEAVLFISYPYSLDLVSGRNLFQIYYKNEKLSVLSYSSETPSCSYEIHDKIALETLHMMMIPRFAFHNIYNSLDDTEILLSYTGLYKDTLQKKNIYSLADIEYKTVDEKGKIKGLKVKSEVGKSIPVKKAEYTFDIGSRLLTFKGDRFEGSVTLP